VILDAAMRVLEREQSIEGVSLRKVAREIGVAPNAIYTYFPSMDVVWNQARELVLAHLLQEDFTAGDCDFCGLRELIRRVTYTGDPALLELYQRQADLGEMSFRFSETILELTKSSPMPSHSARNLILAWLAGRASLLRQRTLEPEWRERQRAEVEAESGREFPLEAAANAEATDSDQDNDVRAMLRALQVECTCGGAHEDAVAK
jgi:AcrR family transcriptional regulator